MTQTHRVSRWCWENGARRRAAHKPSLGKNTPSPCGAARNEVGCPAWVVAAGGLGPRVPSCVCWDRLCREGGSRGAARVELEFTPLISLVLMGHFKHGRKWPQSGQRATGTPRGMVSAPRPAAPGSLGGTHQTGVIFPCRHFRLQLLGMRALVLLLFYIVRMPLLGSSTRHNCQHPKMPGQRVPSLEQRDPEAEPSQGVSSLCPGHSRPWVSHSRPGSSRSGRPSCHPGV